MSTLENPQAAAAAVLFPNSQDICEREPIRTPGVIQPHGALLIADPDTLALLGWSANANRIPGLRSLDTVKNGPLAEHRLSSFLDASMIRRLIEATTEGLLNEGRHFSMHLPGEDGPNGSEMLFHRHDGLLYCEWEPLDGPFGPAAAAGFPSSLHDLGAQVCNAIRDESDFDRLAERTACAIRRITGYERVLIYRFDKGGHGEVVAESKVEDWEQSFIGFHFPATDIPAQARALYRTSHVRFVPRRDYVPCPVIPECDPRTGKSFDLGHCRLRSLSPIHQMYQKNMGVDGSMSLSVISDGRLWGLVVGHHRKPHAVPQAMRTLACMVTDMYAARLTAMEHSRDRNTRAALVDLYARLLEQIVGADDFVAALTRGPVRLTDLFRDVHGGAVVRRGEWEPGVRDLDSRMGEDTVTAIGETPPEDAIRALARWVREQGGEDNLFYTESLGFQFPPLAPHADKASGLLAILLGEEREHVILWFRPQVVRSITWGGNPTKPHRPGKDDTQVLPRSSFERWVEVRRGHAEAWEPWELAFAHSLRGALNDLILRRMRVIGDLNAKLAESNRIKSEFLANMSHELRTPLNAIIGYSDTLAAGVMGRLNDKQTQYLEDIRGAGHHLLDLINNILDLSTIESGRLHLNEEDVFLPELIGAALRLHAPVIEEAGLTVRPDVPADLPGLRADARLIRQILTNLLSNAVKFTQPGGTIAIAADLDPSGAIRLSISDTGKGIAPEHMEDVLTPFRQEDSHVAKAGAGSGLGLPIAKSLMELHQGTLRLDSRPGRGTTVHLTFPASRVLRRG